jgi:hypothetical protein
MRLPWGFALAAIDFLSIFTDNYPLMITFIYTIIFALLASLSAKIGIIYSLSKENLSTNTFLRFINGLAIGLILGMVFLFFWPISHKSIQAYDSWSLIGIVIFLALDRYLNNPISFSEQEEKKKSLNGTKIYSCQIFINLSYGAALSVGFKMGFIKGGILALGIILYQYPRSILNLNTLKNNWSFRSAIIGSFLNPFTIPIGAVITLFILNAPIFPAYFIRPVYGITTGLLIYLGTSDIIRRTDACPSSIAFGIGVITILLIKTFSF